MAYYRPDSNLLQLSTIAVVASAWSSPQVVSRVKEFFRIHVNAYKNVHQKETDATASKRDWDNIMCDIELQLNDTGLPPKLKENLQLVAMSMGTRIHHFLEDIAVKLISYGKFKRFHEDIEYYIRNIRWTSFGTIDAVKIFMQRYLDETIPNDYFMWYESCVYCLEDYVRNLWSQMSDKLKSKTMSSVWSTAPEFVPVGFWQKQIEGDVSDYLLRLREEQYSDLPDYSTLENMLLISVALGLPEAVKHYWQQLSSEQKEQNRLRIFEVLQKEQQYYLTFYKTHPSKSYSDILAFTVAASTKEQILLFANGLYFRLLLTLLESPWENLFLQTLDDVWDRLEDNDYRDLVRYFVDMMSKDDMVKWRAKYRNILLHIWRNLPRRFKENINSNNMNFLAPLAVCDVAIVRSILNDPHVQLTTMDFLCSSQSYWQSLIRSGQYNTLDNYVRTMCLTDREIEDWLNSIDVEKICVSFLKGRKCKEADEFLSWKFGGNWEEVRLFKDHLVIDKCCFAPLITNTWAEMSKDNGTECKGIIINYIKWFTSYDETKLTAKSLKDNAYLCQIFVNLCDNLKFDVFDKIFSYYSLTYAEIEALKRTIFWEYVLYIPKNLMTDSYIYKIEINFKWACDNIDKKCSFVTDFLLSEDAKKYFTAIASDNMNDNKRVSFFKEIRRVWFEVLSRIEITNFIQELNAYWNKEKVSDDLRCKYNVFIMHLQGNGNN